MRGHTCSGGWRALALLLGVSWLVTLAVACGGGDDAVAPAAAPAPQAQTSALALGLAHNAAAMPTPPLQPCADEPRQAAKMAAVPAHLRAPVVQDHGLSDEALKSPLGEQGVSAAGVQLADPFDTQ